ncbi:Predicted L-lactate dehydrogenase, Iron-sulfur cluster-binding subunit YkgF, partial [hydrothermal vent metagenome]
CPVYKNIGGHTYDTTYSGPIGAVITPYMKDLKTYNHLSFASSLCGKCTEVCPVKIPIHQLLLVNRDDAVKNGFYTYFDKTSMKISTKVLMSRKLLDLTGGKMKNFGAGMFVDKVWGPRRELPKFAEKSFSKQWREKYGEVNE